MQVKPKGPSCGQRKKNGKVTGITTVEEVETYKGQADKRQGWVGVLNSGSPVPKDFIFVCGICVFFTHMSVFTHVCTVCPHLCLWKPKFNLHHLPLSLSTYFLEKNRSLHLEFTDSVVLTACFPPDTWLRLIPNTGNRCTFLPNFYMDIGHLKSCLVVFTESTSPTEPSHPPLLLFRNFKGNSFH